VRWTVEDVVAEGDRVVCRLTMRGTQTGRLDFEVLPLRPSNRSFTSEQIHMMRIVNGKIVEHWAGRDDLGMLRQLGHLAAVTGQVKS
jgi:predicted ester cyclase